MNQLKKLKMLRDLSYFDKNTLAQIIDLSDNSLYANIKRWLKNGNLIQLKRGLYVTTDFVSSLKNKNYYVEFIANKLREPSYLSTEYVLQKYAILTEAVYATTSVTLKNKRIYKNKFGTFIYRNISERLFEGYKIRDFDNYSIKEATKAKALFDYLYLKLYREKMIDEEFVRSLRLNLDEFSNYDLREFTSYCKLSTNKKMLLLSDIIGDIM